MAEIKETFSMYCSWKEAPGDADLNQMAEWLSKEVDGEYKIKKDEDDDGWSLYIIKEVE